MIILLWYMSIGFFLGFMASLILEREQTDKLAIWFLFVLTWPYMLWSLTQEEDDDAS